MATACGHEPLAVGAVVLIDTRSSKRSKDAMTSLTPEVTTSGLRGIHHYRNGRRLFPRFVAGFRTVKFVLDSWVINSYLRPRWRRDDLQEYEGALPSKADDIWRKIRRRYPHAACEVEYFDADPLLWVRVGSERICVFRW